MEPTGVASAGVGQGVNDETDVEVMADDLQGDTQAGRHKKQKTSAEGIAMEPTGVASAGVGQGVDDETGIEVMVDDLIEHDMDETEDFVRMSLAVPNFASLGNIIQTMKSHGPPVNQWEGDVGGEKTIQVLKPFIHGMCISNGHSLKAALMRYYNYRVLSDINVMLEDKATLFQAGHDKCHKEKCKQYTNTKCYKAREVIEGLINEGAEVTGFLFQNSDTNEQVIVAEVGRADSPTRYLRLRLGDDVVPLGDDIFVLFACLLG